MSRTQLSRLTVLRTEDLTPSMRRIVLGEGDVDRLIERWQGYTDTYVKLAFLNPAFSYPELLDMAQIRETMPNEAWPILRTYTIRRLDASAREVWIDFVIHGDEGLAGPWAKRAEPGQSIPMAGPGAGYRPEAEVDHHLMVGDESALPAIAAALESLGAGQRATAFIEVDGPEHEQGIVTEAEVDLHWLHRAPAHAGTTTLLDDAVRAWAWPEGRVQAFVHGESALLKTVRPYLAREREVPRGDLSVSAYWRLGETEEGFRAWKQSERDRGDDPMWRPGDAKP